MKIAGHCFGVRCRNQALTWQRTARTSDELESTTHRRTQMRRMSGSEDVLSTILHRLACVRTLTISKGRSLASSPLRQQPRSRLLRRKPKLLLLQPRPLRPLLLPRLRLAPGSSTVSASRPALALRVPRSADGCARRTPTRRLGHRSRLRRQRQKRSEELRREQAMRSFARGRRLETARGRSRRPTHPASSSPRATA